MPLIYTVFSTTDSPYQQWQSELLEYSWRQVRQPGELIRFVATTGETPLPVHRHARTIATPLRQVHPETGDDYAPYNKTAALVHWLETERPDGTVLLIDPDCVFRRAVCREVSEGRPVSQKWIGLVHEADGDGFALDRRFAFLEERGVRPRTRAQLAMIPTLIHTTDLRRIAARWHELTALVRHNVTDCDGRRMWESDMFGYAIVTAEAGLEHELASLGICTNWSPDDAVDAPMIHYCQAIEGVAGESLFSKYEYKAWRRVAGAARAKEDYGRDLLTLVNRCVSDRAAIELQGVRPRSRVGVREIRGDGGLVLCAPGSNREFSLNPAAVRVWALCDGARTVSTIRHELEQEFDTTDGMLPEVLMDALGTLYEANLLVFERG